MLSVYLNKIPAYLKGLGLFSLPRESGDAHRDVSSEPGSVLPTLTYISDFNISVQQQEPLSSEHSPWWIEQMNENKQLSI